MQITASVDYISLSEPVRPTAAATTTTLAITATTGRSGEFLLLRV